MEVLLHCPLTSSTNRLLDEVAERVVWMQLCLPFSHHFEDPWKMPQKFVFNTFFLMDIYDENKA